jgi:PKD repeat protein
MKKRMVFGVIFLIALMGFSVAAEAFNLVDWLKQLYGIEPAAEEEYVPIEDIKIQGDEQATPPTPPGTEIPSVTGEATAPTTTVAQKGDAKVLIVEETDTVNLKPKATDPDQDALSFSYTTPLDKDGQWKTTYGDAGEYTVTITASDGSLSTTKDVLIIVKKKEEAPVIVQAIPDKESIDAQENQRLDFSVKATDLNKDPLTYSWKLDGNQVSTKDAYIYAIGYNDAGQHTVKVTVSDGTKEASKIWAIKVANVNRKPVLNAISPIDVKETDLIRITPSATDPDNDKITYQIDSSKFKKVDDSFEWQTTYDDAGDYTVMVTASDGTDEVSQPVQIKVENVNRAPVIEDVVLG